MIISHVGFVVPRESLDGPGRRRIVDFFSACLGFEERVEHTRDSEMLVLMLGSIDRYIILYGRDDTNPPGNWHLDHCGVLCDSLDQLRSRAERVRAYAAGNPALEFEDYTVVDQPASRGGPAHRVHKFYVRLWMPFAIELQYWEWLGPPYGQDARVATVGTEAAR